MCQIGDLPPNGGCIFRPTRGVRYAPALEQAGGLMIRLTGTLVAVVAAAAVAASPAAAAISFETPSVADPIHPFGEPSVGVDGLGRAFVSGPTGNRTQRHGWPSSLAGGHTFRVITSGPPPSAVQGIQDPPGGGDTDLAFDSHNK